MEEQFVLTTSHIPRSQTSHHPVLPWDHGGLVIRTRFWSRRVRDPIPLKIRRVWGLLHAKSCVGVVRKFGEGVLAQVSSSSSDHGLKLRGLSQIGPSVVSKRDVNITKLNQSSLGIQFYVE
ncbi:hypothetical protein AVEN_203035-1 [Araneus ventricosus]|uniref:Uncharacterized protein n=1 Tax=Araneus ventricosus TaxID=182803 RepID=A0A4Y2S4Q5_ARAVE|nr:hypothetical protein AVEN_203035-1 [Araneus ventricosus]